MKSITFFGKYYAFAEMGLYGINIGLSRVPIHLLGASLRTSNPSGGEISPAFGKLDLLSLPLLGHVETIWDSCLRSLKLWNLKFQPYSISSQ